MIQIDNAHIQNLYSDVTNAVEAEEPKNRSVDTSISYEIFKDAYTRAFIPDTSIEDQKIYLNSMFLNALKIADALNLNNIHILSINVIDSLQRARNYRDSIISKCWICFIQFRKLSQDYATFLEYSDRIPREDLHIYIDSLSREEKQTLLKHLNNINELLKLRFSYIITAIINRIEQRKPEWVFPD